MFKVHIISGNQQYHRMFLDRGFAVAKTPEEADFLQFTGGHDVTPNFYGAKKHPSTSNSERRDDEEDEIYQQFLYKKPMAGICRGGQFLWVMNGGTMFQDVTGHAIHGTHEVVHLETLEKKNVTSTHHQMMRHSEETLTTAKLIAVASHCRSKVWWDDWQEEFKEGYDGFDIEVAAFPDTMSLCFQPHPEFGPGDCQDYYFECLGKYILPYINQG